MKLEEGFLIEAEADRKSARVNFKAGLYSKAVQHAQDCCEKAIKALLAGKGRVGIIQHRVSDLFLEVFVMPTPSEKNEAILKALQEIERNAGRTRYPFLDRGKLMLPSQKYTDRDASRALDIADMVFDFAAQSLKK